MLLPLLLSEDGVLQTEAGEARHSLGQEGRADWGEVDHPQTELRRGEAGSEAGHHRPPLLSASQLRM